MYYCVVILFVAGAVGSSRIIFTCSYITCPPSSCTWDFPASPRRPWYSPELMSRASLSPSCRPSTTTWVESRPIIRARYGMLRTSEESNVPSSSLLLFLHASWVGRLLLNSTGVNDELLATLPFARVDSVGHHRAVFCTWGFAFIVLSKKRDFIDWMQSIMFRKNNESKSSSTVVTNRINSCSLWAIRFQWWGVLIHNSGMIGANCMWNLIYQCKAW